MEYKEGYVSDYNTSEVDWGEEECAPESDFQEEGSWRGEEASHHSWGSEGNSDAEKWSDETDSNISCDDALGRENEPEQEPPVLYHTMPKYPKPWNSWNPSSRAIFHPTYKSKTSLHYNDEYKYLGPESFLFSGLDYLQWEANMQKYFKYYKTPHEEKMSIALGQLRGKALKWWDRDEYDRWYYNEPQVKTWKELKWVMCKRYSPHELLQSQQTNSHNPTTTNDNGQGLKLKTRLTFKEETDKMNKSFDHVLSLIKSLSCPKVVEIGLGTKEELDTIKDEPKAMAELPPLQDVVSKQRSDHGNNSGTPQDKCCVLKSLELTCYRCHKKGHFAATCPKRQLEKSTPLGLKTGTNARNVPSNLENFSSCIMHLSFPKVIDAGPGHATESKNEKYFPRITIEEPSDRAASQHALLNTANNFADTLHQDVAQPHSQICGSLSLILMEEEPPDPFKHFSLAKTRGNLLNPHLLRWTNLVCLCVGKSVLRTKPLEERGNDAHLASEASPKLTWTTFSSLLGSTSNWNQPERSSHEEVMADTIHMGLNLTNLDLCILKRRFQANHEEPNDEVTCFGNLTQSRSSESWNPINICCGSNVMNFTTRRILHLFHLDAAGFGRLQSYVWNPGRVQIILETLLNTKTLKSSVFTDFI